MSGNERELNRGEYRAYFRRLESPRKFKNLDSLENLADEIEAKWGQSAEVQYFELMLKLSNTLSSFDFGDYHRQAALAQKYSTLALEKSEAIPVETELGLLLHQQDDTEYLKSLPGHEEWSQRRRRKARLWLRAWHRLENGIDRDFDFNDYPLVNVTPPPGVNMPPGVAPEHISDPRLRAEYEAAIAENARKAERYNQQHRIRQLEQQLLPKAEKYLITAYSRAPSALPELEGLLGAYVSDEEKRARILAAVGRQ